MLSLVTNQTIRDAVTEAVSTESIYLFGSQAQGNARKDSDIDLAVILTAGGFMTYQDRVGARVLLSRQLKAVKAEYDVDLIVYTKDEWKQLQSSDSSFIRAIKNGEKLA